MFWWILPASSAVSFWAKQLTTLQPSCLHPLHLHQNSTKVPHWLNQRSDLCGSESGQMCFVSFCAQQLTTPQPSCLHPVLSNQNPPSCRISWGSPLTFESGHICFNRFWAQQLTTPQLSCLLLCIQSKGCQAAELAESALWPLRFWVRTDVLCQLLGKAAESTAAQLSASLAPKPGSFQAAALAESVLWSLRLWVKTDSHSPRPCHLALLCLLAGPTMVLVSRRGPSLAVPSANSLAAHLTLICTAPL